MPGRGRAVAAATWGAYDEGREGDALWQVPLWVNMPVEVRVQVVTTLPAGVHSAASGRAAANGALLAAQLLGRTDTALRLSIRTAAPRQHTLDLCAGLLGALAAARSLGRSLSPAQLEQIGTALGLVLPHTRGLHLVQGRQALRLGPAVELGAWLLTLPDDSLAIEDRSLASELRQALSTGDDARFLAITTARSLALRPQLADLWQWGQKQGASGLVACSTAPLAALVFPYGRVSEPALHSPKTGGATFSAAARLTGWQFPI